MIKYIENYERILTEIQFKLATNLNSTAQEENVIY